METADGGVEGVVVGSNGATTGIFRGSTVTVYGTVVDTQSFTSTADGAITQPMVSADRIETG